MYLKNDLLSILANNEVVAKYKDVPEYVDNRDEIVSELQEILDDDGHLPDSMRYFLVNGKTNAIEITDYLEKIFARFKTDFLDGKNNAALITELLTQLERIKKNISQAIYEAKQIKDETLIEMMDVKLLFLERLIDYLAPLVDSSKIAYSPKENNSSISISKQKQKPTKDMVYYFRVNKEFTNDYESNLNRLYWGLKDELEFIDCTPVEFKDLFRPNGTTYRKTPKPIIWKSGAYAHLAYFIKCLKDKKFIPDSKRPSFNQIAIELFYDQIEGEFFENIVIKSDVDDPNIYPYIEIKNMVDKILKN